MHVAFNHTKLVKMFRKIWFSLLPLIILTCLAAKIQTDDVKTKETPRNKDMITQRDMDVSPNGEEEMNQMEMEIIIDQCNETYTIEMSYWQFLNESGSFPDETFITPKCFVNCVLMMTRVASLGGMFDASRAAEVFTGERGGKTMDDLEDLAKGCADDRREMNGCERGYGFLKCLMEKEIEKYETYNPEENH